MSPHILTDAMIDQAAAALEVTAEHRQSFPFFLMSAFSFSKSAAGEVALNFLQEGTLYAHIAERGMQFFPQVINDLGIKTNWFLLHETLPALALLRGSTPVCKRCGFLCIGRDERRAWKIFRVREICPNPECHATIEWSPPTTIHFNWVTREWVSLSEHFDKKSTDAPLPILLSKIVDFIDRMGGLHPDIIQLLERHAIALPALLAALWVENPVLYHNKQRSVLWAVSKDHYGNQYLFDDRTLLKVANIAKGYVPPVWEGALFPAMPDRGSRPPVQKKPPLGKLVEHPPISSGGKIQMPGSWSPPSHDSGSTSVVLLYAKKNQEAALELTMHLAPLFAVHGIRLWDVNAAEFPDRELQGEISKAAQIICLLSTPFFNETIHGGLIEHATDLMSAWHLQDKTFAVRLETYTQPTEGYYRDFRPLPHRPLSLARDPDGEWKEIVDQLRQRLFLKRFDTPHEPHMIPKELQMKAFSKLLGFTEYQFRAVLESLDMNWREFSPMRQGSREQPLVSHCVRHGTFIALRQAIQTETMPIALR